LTFLAAGFTIQLAKEYGIDQAGAVDAREDSMATTPSLFPETEQDIFSTSKPFVFHTKSKVLVEHRTLRFGGRGHVGCWKPLSALVRAGREGAHYELGRFARIVSFQRGPVRLRGSSRYHPVGNLVPKSFDLLADLHRRLGFRIKLDDLARETLGHQKKRQWPGNRTVVARGPERRSLQILRKRCAIIGGPGGVCQAQEVCGCEQAPVARRLALKLPAGILIDARK